MSLVHVADSRRLTTEVLFETKRTYHLAPTNPEGEHVNDGIAGLSNIMVHAFSQFHGGMLPPNSLLSDLAAFALAT